MKALIIDDEPHCRNVITQILKKYCPEISATFDCKDGQEGLEYIRRKKPDIVFLDVEMPHMNGFQMLEKLTGDELTFALVFTTAYDQFAIKAIKYSAFDYLLKPIDETELAATVQKIRAGQSHKEQIQFLKSNYWQTNFNKVTVASVKGIRFLDLDEIIAVEADGNYSRFHLTSPETVLASKTLGYYEDILQEKGFFRTHKQFIINARHIREYVGGDYNFILMANGLQAKLARTKRDEFLALFER
ncbi:MULTISPECIES: response regulator [unclassified Spirosoma]|uniref:LytR/AlgR family response regulator transcription factor n=1 Tax=unclassified Spirosoma TaxID=2621999 RepID=UPI000967563E|nr:MULTISPECIES: response regulator [unclassified Spirosoma]MBN8822423.1 response regulator [Spirosoma sp.]OJW73715.1 MAG: hypothetical protein BGO59_18165 [Spirosoma sp. 48-14]